jgi:NADH dehydrogenase I D subunit
MSKGDTSVQALQEQFPGSVLDASSFRGETTVVVRAADILPICRFLRDDPGLAYDLCVFVSALDQLDLGHAPRFVAIYQLYSLQNRCRLRLHAPLSGEPPAVDSVASIWPAADWHERETFDLFGIQFKGHPELRRILLPYDWVGHPLRKDYALGGEPVQFTVNPDDPALASLGEQTLEAPTTDSDVPPWFSGRDETMILNMGPQHPATHGVLRVVVELDGERIVNAAPDIGHLHSGFEKTAEHRTYQQFAVYPSRMDYVAGMSNDLSFILAVEKLVEAEVPPRATVIRVILLELQRLAAHLIWIATQTLDLSGTIHALLQYAFRDREMILDIFEMVCGARITTSYFTTGGLRWDVPPAFPGKVLECANLLEKRLPEYETMLTRNPVYRSRLEGIAVISAEQAIGLGCTGPLLRGCGVGYDLRKHAPYCGYEEYDFEVPTQPLGDAYARYQVRVAEMHQSLNIIRQGLGRLQAIGPGPVVDPNRKISLPPRPELETSMEAVIHHFKLVTEGFSPPVGEVYSCVENPKGELGFYLVSDGGPRPYRCKIRGPSFSNISALRTMAPGSMFSDMVSMIASIDITLGEVDRSATPAVAPLGGGGGRGGVVEWQSREERVGTVMPERAYRVLGGMAVQVAGERAASEDVVLSEESRVEIQRIRDEYPDPQSALLPALVLAQRDCGRRQLLYTSAAETGRPPSCPGLYQHLLLSAGRRAFAPAPGPKARNRTRRDHARRQVHPH